MSSKFIMKDCQVEIDGVDLSNWSFNVDTPSEKAVVDVSGFNPNGTTESLVGNRSDTATVQMTQDFSTGGPHQTLYPLYRDDVEFTVIIKHTSDATSASNPELRGRGKISTYNGLSGALNARGEFTLTINAADVNGLVWYDAVS